MHSFKHEALMYAGEEDFVGQLAPFIRDSVDADEPILVMVTADKVARLREAVGDPEGVEFAEMGAIGKNPAHSTPACRDSPRRPRGERIRGIGEPIWADREPDELVECQHHESLLNTAFADASGFRLVCPYDTTALAWPVIDEARRSHPTVVTGDEISESELYRGHDRAAHAFGDRL